MSIRSTLIYVSVLFLFGSCKKGTTTEADADLKHVSGLFKME